MLVSQRLTLTFGTVIPSFHFQSRSCSGPEHLCRYITRPAIANERLKCNRAGQVVFQLKSSHKDGTTHIVMSPLEFMQLLGAVVPVRPYISSASMACSRRTRCCFVKSFPVQQSMQLSYQPITLTRRVCRRG